MTKSLGIVIPVYTSLPFLQELIQSLGEQAQWLDALVFVDDNNPEEIANYLRESLERFHGKATLIVNETPQGITRSTKRGIDSIDTDFVGFVDSDDVLMPNALITIRRAIDLEPDASLISSRFMFWDGKSRRGAANRSRDQEVLGTDWRDFVVTDNQISHLKIVSRKLLDRVDWHPNIDGVQDAIVNFSLLPNERVVLIPKALYLHRVHASQHSNTLSSTAARELNAARRNWLHTVLGGSQPDEFPRLFWEAGAFGRIQKALKQNFLLSVSEELDIRPIDYFRAIEEHTSLRDENIVVALSDRSFGLTRQLVKILHLRPRSISFYLESSNPQSWHMAKVFSGVFDAILLDNRLLLPALRATVPDSVKIITPNEVDVLMMQNAQVLED